MRFEAHKQKAAVTDVIKLIEDIRSGDKHFFQLFSGITFVKFREAKFIIPVHVFQHGIHTIEPGMFKKLLEVILLVFEKAFYIFGFCSFETIVHDLYIQQDRKPYQYAR